MTPITFKNLYDETEYENWARVLKSNDPSISGKNALDFWVEKYTLQLQVFDSPFLYLQWLKEENIEKKELSEKEKDHLKNKFYKKLQDLFKNTLLECMEKDEIAKIIVADWNQSQKEEYCWINQFDLVASKRYNYAFDKAMKDLQIGETGSLKSIC